MHNNYYFLRKLIPDLRMALVGGVVVEVFSQNKDELILGFANTDREFYIKAHLTPSFCCLQFPDTFHRAKKNSVDLFPSIVGAKVQEVRQFENERSFLLELDNAHQLLFKMHGNRANVVLFQDKEVVALFRNSLAKDQHLSLASLDRSLNPSFEDFVAAEGKPQAVYPTLGKLPVQYLRQQGYTQLNIEQQWDALQKLVKQLENAEQLYVTYFDDQWHLSLLKMGEVAETFAQPMAALNAFFLRYVKTARLASLKKHALQHLRRELKQADQYLKKTYDKLDLLTTGSTYQETADIIMANLHQIPANTKQVELYDFYHDQAIAVTLNPSLSPQKNAERYYRKAKNQKKETDQIEKNLLEREEKQEILQAQLQTIEALEDPKTLQEYLETHHLLPRQQETTPPPPYRHTTVEGFEILIGKSAKSNDTLLRDFSWKEDLWLHAKDVSGSHVIIKHQAGRPFPPQVKERAAQLAAYYSKRKQDTLCPVIITPRKYVRKSKHLPPGAVLVDREEVILVEPKGMGEE